MSLLYTFYLIHSICVHWHRSFSLSPPRKTLGPSIISMPINPRMWLIVVPKSLLCSVYISFSVSLTFPEWSNPFTLSSSSGLFSLWSLLLVEFSTELFIWIIELTSSFQVDFSSAITFLYWILFSYVRLISFLLSALLLFSWHLLMPSLSYLNIVIITLLNFLSKNSSDIFGYCRLIWIPCLEVLPSLSHGGSYYNLSNIWRRRVLGFCVCCVCFHAGYHEFGVSLLAESFWNPRHRSFF